MILDGSFDDNLIPNILQVVDLVDNLNSAIEAEKEANSPVAVLKYLFNFC